MLKFQLKQKMKNKGSGEFRLPQLNLVNMARGTKTNAERF